MPLATSASALPSPSALVKMEDRKRPAVGHADDLAPPSKRQAINGGSKSRDDAGDMKEEAWIEEFQKGAIYRQMLEYKREKATLESRIEEIERRSRDHDDHIRIIDAWWLQLLEEVELLVEGSISSLSTAPGSSSLSSLSFKDSREFQQHLADKAKSIRSRIEAIFSRVESSRGEVKPEIVGLESQVKSLLASQKEYGVKMERLNSEKEDLSVQLNTATLRYVKAEKKLDRARSSQVQKLEQQALANATSRPAPSGNENGVEATEKSGETEALRLQHQEAVSVAAKQKEQLDAAYSEIKELQAEVTAFKTRKDIISEEDYAKTDVFKMFRNQNEDLIKRINHLEAMNRQLREEAEKLQAERTAFRTQLESEAQTLTGELEDQMQQKDHDLTRIRSARDELFADLTMRKASQEQERHVLEHMKELFSAKEDRIAALEQELERLRPDEDIPTATGEELEALSLEELREKYLKSEKNVESLSKELPSMEKAYKKTVAMAQKKVMDFAALEDRVAVLTAEKAKADQKYFAARKDMDTRILEIRTIRQQNLKSSEIIAQLKEVEAQTKTLLANFEKQLSELRQSNSAVLAENKKLESSSTDTMRRAESVKAQIVDLSNLIKSKEAANGSTRERNASLETEVEKLKVRLDHVQKDRDNWKLKGLSNSSDEEEMLRTFALCAICRSNFKNCILKTCGHVFCNNCIDSRISNRMRKCPTCGKAFDKVDVMAAHH